MTNVTLSRVGVIVPARLLPACRQVQLPQQLEFFRSISQWATSDQESTRLIVIDPCGETSFPELFRVFREQEIWVATVAVLREYDLPKSWELYQQGMVTPIAWKSGQSLASVLTAAVCDGCWGRAERLASALRRFYSLDSLERHVLKLLMAGLRNKAVGAQLELGQRTVDARKRRILTKFQTDSISQVIRQVAWIEITVSWDVWEIERLAG